MMDGVNVVDSSGKTSLVVFVGESIEENRQIVE